MYSKDYLKSIENTILCMDCNDFLKECPDKCFDLVLTDAPYGGGGTEEAFSQGCNRFGGRFEKYDTAAIAYAKEKGTPVLEKAAREVKAQAAKVCKEILAKLED